MTGKDWYKVRATSATFVVVPNRQSRLDVGFTVMEPTHLVGSSFTERFRLNAVGTERLVIFLEKAGYPADLLALDIATGTRNVEEERIIGLELMVRLQVNRYSAIPTLEVAGYGFASINNAVSS